MLGAWKEIIRSLTGGDSSQGMVEYGLVVAVVTIALIVPLRSACASLVELVRIVELMLSSI